MSEETHLTDIPFSQLGLDPQLLQGLEAIQLQYCTPIQAKTLPLALQGKNVAGQAQTGTGKTIAFLLALLQCLLQKDAAEDHQEIGNTVQIRGLILAPTRELAIQIHRDAVALSQQTDLRLGIVYGGEDYKKQRQQVADGIDILIGTPGRVIDYFKQGVFAMQQLQCVVLDEADRMFDLGFIKDLRYLFHNMPPADQRLNLLFSATLSLRVSELAYECMDAPTEVKIEQEQVVAEKVEERLYHLARNEKMPLLKHLLQSEQEIADSTLIFTNTKRAAEYITRQLNRQQPTAILSGDVPQRKRLSLLQQFQKGRYRILVATDVAARGLHIASVSHVINYDLPQDPEDYVHRVGRTARAGTSGEAITFACEDYVYSLPEIENYIGHKIPVATVDAELLENLSKAHRDVVEEQQDTPYQRHERRHSERQPPAQRQPEPRSTSERDGDIPINRKLSITGRRSPRRRRVLLEREVPALFMPPPLTE